jgi:hydrogenase maturation protease
VLVIGYGNSLRRDDGIGPWVAARLAERGLPGVRVVAAHQLTPELAEDLAGCRTAFFVDARAGAGEPVEVRPVLPATPDSSLTHACDPRTLLALARSVYECNPDAWWVVVGGRDFSLGDGLSPDGVRNARAAVGRVVDLLNQGGKE